jgi:hypothetical protein
MPSPGGGQNMPQDRENLVWARLKELEKQNPELAEAMRVLNITREQYLSILASITEPSSSVSNTTG